MGLTREEILAAKDMPPLKKLNVPEWGGDIYLRALELNEKDIHDQHMLYWKGKKGNVTGEVKNLRASKLAKVIVDEAGKRLFSDADIEALGKKNAVVMCRIWDESEAIDAVDKEAIDEAEKNSETTPSDSTATT